MNFEEVQDNETYATAPQLFCFFLCCFTVYYKFKAFGRKMRKRQVISLLKEAIHVFWEGRRKQMNRKEFTKKTLILYHLNYKILQLDSAGITLTISSTNALLSSTTGSIVSSPSSFASSKYREKGSMPMSSATRSFSLKSSNCCEIWPNLKKKSKQKLQISRKKKSRKKKCMKKTTIKNSRQRKNKFVCWKFLPLSRNRDQKNEKSKVPQKKALKNFGQKKVCFPTWNKAKDKQERVSGF